MNFSTKDILEEDINANIRILAKEILDDAIDLNILNCSELIRREFERYMAWRISKKLQSIVRINKLKTIAEMAKRG